jgi:hypothetical protein
MKFAFPDEGAFKRFGKPLQKHCPSLYRDGNVVICGKVKSNVTINFFTLSPVTVPPSSRLRLISSRRRALATTAAFGSPTATPKALMWCSWMILCVPPALVSPLLYSLSPDTRFAGSDGRYVDKLR